jgi:hypothetical protein
VGVAFVADLSEFNDTIGSTSQAGNNVTADLVDGGEIYIGYIGDNVSFPPNLDVDLIGVDLAAGAVLTAQTRLFTEGGATQGDTVLRIFNQFGLQVDFDDDGAGGLQSVLNFTAPESGQYYIGVSGFSNVGYDPNTAGSGSPGSSNFGYELAITTRDFNSLEYIASHG